MGRFGPRSSLRSALRSKFSGSRGVLRPKLPALRGALLSAGSLGFCFLEFAVALAGQATGHGLFAFAAVGLAVPVFFGLVRAEWAGHSAERGRAARRGRCQSRRARGARRCGRSWCRCAALCPGAGRSSGRSLPGRKPPDSRCPCLCCRSSCRQSFCCRSRCRLRGCRRRSCCRRGASRHRQSSAATKGAVGGAPKGAVGRTAEGAIGGGPAIAAAAATVVARSRPRGRLPGRSLLPPKPPGPPALRPPRRSALSSEKCFLPMGRKVACRIATVLGIKNVVGIG